MAEGFARQQLEGASKRLSDLVGENIASGPTMRKTADALTVGQKAEAAPLYAEAFKPGSVAPLKAQFEGEFNRVSRDAKEAAEAVSAAQRDMIQAQAKVSRAGDNVYSANVALRARAEAQQALKEAQAKAIAARTESQQVLSRLREAQSAEAAGQRGGVWSPRIQQFLNDPTLKPAIARGMEIQRLEALAEGRPFNPHDFSITGEEKDGSPIIGKVPNMRLLDAVKKGIDDMLEHYRSDITGKLVLDERGRALDQVRRSYIKTLDELNPDYSKARAAWAGPAQAKGTMGLGSKHLSRNVEENEKIWSGLSPSDRQFYLIGVADHLRDEIAKKGVTSPMVNALKEGSHNSRIKEQLRMLFSDQAKFDQFLKSVTDERTIFEKAGERLRGSQTAERLGADEENGLAAGAHALAAGAKVVNGHWAGAIQSLVAAKRDLGIIGDKKVNDALAKLLFDPSIDLNGPVGLRLIGRIPVAQAKAMSYVERFRRLTSPAAAAGGALAQQGQQPGNQGNPTYAQ
jgi:hypothetical protein